MSDDLIKEEDWLRQDYRWRLLIENEAKNIIAACSAIAVIPKTEHNRHTLEGQWQALEEACHEMKLLIEGERT